MKAFLKEDVRVSQKSNPPRNISVALGETAH